MEEKIQEGLQRTVTVTSHRVKAFTISPEGVAEILSGQVRPVGLPEGITVERFAVEWETNSAVIIVSHPAWPEVSKGLPIEKQPLMCQKIHRAPLEYKRVEESDASV